MTRPLRIEFPSAYYHVMNRGLAHHRTFLSSRDHHLFVSLLADIAERWQVRIFAYCCMGNHFHLLLQTPRGNLSRVMRHLDGVYTQRFNRGHQRDGPLFRGRYKSILVEAETYLLQVVRYIHLNPVKAGLVDDPADYPWGSHRLYRREVAPEWLARGIVLACFPSVRAFEQFVAEGNDRALEAFYRRKRQSPILGDGLFAEWALAKARLSTEHTRAHMTPNFPSVEAIAAKICGQMGVNLSRVRTSERGARNLPRDLAIFVAGRRAGFSYSEIRNYFGLTRNSAVSQVILRTSKFLAQNPRFQRIVTS
ncbi:MAG: transposase [Armatimonadetes bacterium]|nr:transposase [Armatimonadota bacterium]